MKLYFVIVPGRPVNGGFFSKFSRNIPCLIFCKIKIFLMLCTIYLLIIFHFLIAFTFWNVWEYVCCNYLLSSWWRHEFWNLPYLSYQAVFLHNQKSLDKKLKILRTKRIKRAFKMKWKTLFIIFKGLSFNQRNESNFKFDR